MNEAIIINTPEGIEAYKLLSLKAALKLETKGIKIRYGFSALSTVRKLTGLKATTAEKMLPKYEAFLREKGILVTP